MGRIIYRSFIQQDKILVSSSTTYVKARRTFSSLTYARKGLYGFQDIPFTKDDGYIFYLFNSKVKSPHLWTSHILILLLSGYHYLFNSIPQRGQLEGISFLLVGIDLYS